MQDPLTIAPLTAPPDADVRVPGSKSYTNRALIVAAMAKGRSTLAGALFSDDTARMADCLRRVGIPIEERPEDCVFEVTGAGGRIPASSAELFVGNSGTTARFIVACLALCRNETPGRYVVDGVPRMRQRPMQPLLDALGQLGARAFSDAGMGCVPIRVESSEVAGGEATLDGDTSSQYFSALLMAGPITLKGVALHARGDMVSKPYIDVTAGVMQAFGARMERDAGYRTLIAPGGQGYRACEYTIEPDASNASYFLAAAAITGGRVRVPGLGRGSAQGDLRLLDAFARMGCSVTLAEEYVEVRGPERLKGITVDANAYSDMAQTLYAMAPFAEGPTEVRNVEHSRLQECDRIAASAAELRRLGQGVEEFADGLRITPRPIVPAEVQTYDDHRMAMAFALVGLKAPGIAIADPGCTAKTFPDYWARLEALRKEGGE